MATSKVGRNARMHDWYLRQREADTYEKYIDDDVWQGRGIMIILRSSMPMLGAAQQEDNKHLRFLPKQRTICIYNIHNKVHQAGDNISRRQIK